MNSIDKEELLLAFLKLKTLHSFNSFLKAIVFMNQDAIPLYMSIRSKSRNSYKPVQG